MIRQNHIILLFLSFLFASCSVKKFKSEALPVSHEEWNNLLEKHVSEAGRVDYKGFIKDSNQLNKYLSVLEAGHPNDKHWSRNEQLAYWINAYNAYTVKLITKHYPVKSIKDIKDGIPFVNTVWDIKFISIEGAKYDLNNIEHGIIRPNFNEPRIHFAVNCASQSCPPLLNQAFNATDLDRQLETVATAFINNEKYNQISQSEVKLSKIFSWFRGDFKKAGGIRTFINKRSDTKIGDQVSIDFLDYSWLLNE